MTMINQPSDTNMSSDAADTRLHGSMGVLHLFFSVMAWNAPLVIVVGIIPIMLMVGNGIATPISFIVAGIIVAAFAVGFTKMARLLPRPGAFYAYITAGLGREIGLGAGLMAAFGYFCGYTGTFAFAGVVLNSLILNTLGGPDIPWWALGPVFVAAVGVLGYFRVDLSAKFLTVFLFLELVIIFVFDAAIFIEVGAEGLSLEPFEPNHWFDGSFGLGLLFAIGMYGGFEVTALFRDEVRDPDRTVPRAAFAVIIFAMTLYSLTAWLFINALGVDNAVASASASPIQSIEGAMLRFGGKFLLDASTIMVTTSTFAVVLCGHNIVSRYVYNLSADNILSSKLSAVHPKHGSPHVASIATSVAAFLVYVPMLIIGVDPTALYAALLGIISFVLILAMILTNVAVPFFLFRHLGFSAPWSTFVCPLIGGVGLATCMVMAATNFELLIGGSKGLAALLMLVIAAVFLSGVAMAIYYRKARPEVYARIGRQ